MKSFLISISLGLLLFCQILLGQSPPQVINLQKGEVLDILLLSQHPDTEEALQSYFQTAFPVAKRMSYQPQPGFKIQSCAQGNHQPSLLILGKWENLEKREAFLTEILKEVPDFHERRREIWSYFGLRYFEIQADLTIEINREAYHAATAHWLTDATNPSNYLQEWLQTVKEMGGEVMCKLTNGKSPFGYQYAPDYFLLTSWENEAAFLAFQQSIQQLPMDNIQHINEFILE